MTEVRSLTAVNSLTIQGSPTTIPTHSIAADSGSVVQPMRPACSSVPAVTGQNLTTLCAKTNGLSLLILTFSTPLALFANGLVMWIVITIPPPVIVSHGSLVSTTFVRPNVMRILTVQMDTFVMIATGALRVKPLVARVMILTVCKKNVICPGLTPPVNTVTALETPVSQDAPLMPTVLNSTLCVEMGVVNISVAVPTLPNAPTATSATHQIMFAPLDVRTILPVFKKYVMCPHLTPLVNTVMGLVTPVFQVALPMQTVPRSTLCVEMVAIIYAAVLTLPNAPMATSATHQIKFVLRIWAATAMT